MVLTLIRATRKAALNCLPALSQSLVLCLRNAFDKTIRQTINPVPSQRRYYRLEQLDLRLVLQMEWCITHHIRAQILKQPFNALKSNTQSAQMQSRTITRGSFLLQPYHFSSSFEDNEVYFCLSVFLLSLT